MSDQPDVSPSVEELPKLDQELQEEVKRASTNLELKQTETEVKTVLPSPADIELEKKEKRFSEVHSGIEAFDADSLRHVKTVENVPEVEKMKVMHSIEKFEKGNLKHAEPQVKDLSWPAEVAKDKVKELVKSFDQKELKHVEPTVKHDPIPVGDETAQ